MKFIAEINDRIKKGEAVIVRADEMPDIVEKDGAKKAAEKVDVVTTATFGAMCSSGAFLNFGHSEPPIKMSKAWLNDVEAYTGLAAVDVYVGATELSTEKDFDYGGAHVIEDLVAGRPIELKAKAYGTDCYPRKHLQTTVTLSDINQALLFNPRNNYQRYVAATNSSDHIVRTYMGTLLPNFGNVNYAGCGEISPLNNDPNYYTIGTGTRIFLGGGEGYIACEGTQHSPKTGFGTITVYGDMKQMRPKYLRGGVLDGYGVSLYVGIGVAIPMLNEKVAKSTAVRNKDIETKVLDYGIASRDRPSLRKVNYEELMSGKIDVGGHSVKTSSMSSFRIADEILGELADWIEHKEFYLTEPARRLPSDTVFTAMSEKKRVAHVSEVMTTPVITAKTSDSVKDVSKTLVKKQIDQIPVISKDHKLAGIVTTWDVTKSSATGVSDLSKIMTSKVIYVKPSDLIDTASRKLEKHGISAVPVIDDDEKVVGILTLSDLNRFYRKEVGK